MRRRRRVPSRRGFTLLETVVAISLAGIVLAIAGSALAAAGDARRTVLVHGERGEADARLRALLTDMLRHPPRAEAVDEPLLRIEHRATGSALVFLSQGVTQPFGTGRIWRVTLDGVTRDGASASVRLLAEPIGRGVAATPVRATLRGARGLEVAVLERALPDERGAWRFDWPVARSRPALVRIQWQQSAAPAMPLVVALDGPGGGA